MPTVLVLCLSILVGYTASVMANSTASAATLISFGVEVSMADRLQMMSSEWSGLATTYLPIYLILMCCLLLPLRWFERRGTWKSELRYVAYTAVTGIGLLLFILGFEQLMGVEGALLASTRDTSGLIVQLFCGALTGVSFAALVRRA